MYWIVCVLAALRIFRLINGENRALRAPRFYLQIFAVRRD